MSKTPERRLKAVEEGYTRGTGVAVVDSELKKRVVELSEDVIKLGNACMDLAKRVTDLEKFNKKKEGA